MSYILDALKKSAKERKRGNLPDMLTAQDIVVEKPRKRLPWPYLLIAALLLNAGLLVWWLAFSQTEKTKDDHTANAPVSLSAKEEPEGVPHGAKQAPEFSPPIRPESKTVERTSVPLLEDKPSDTSVKDPLRGKGVEEVTGAERKIASHQPAAANITHVPPERRPAKQKQAEGINRPTEASGALPEVLDENKIYRLSELPSSVRQNLPAFSISALLYSSNPASRMVNINGQMMYEGQDLTGGLKVEEITRDGVIFRHQKIRFRVELK